MHNSESELGLLTGVHPPGPQTWAPTAIKTGNATIQVDELTKENHLMTVNRHFLIIKHKEMKTQDSVKSKICREHRCGRGSISNNSISHRRKISWQRSFLISAATLFPIFGTLWADDEEQTLGPRSVLENSAAAKNRTFSVKKQSFLLANLQHFWQSEKCLSNVDRWALTYDNQT